MAEDAPWAKRDEQEGLYLRARLTPVNVTTEQAENLDWQGLAAPTVLPARKDADPAGTRRRVGPPRTTSSWTATWPPSTHSTWSCPGPADRVARPQVGCAVRTVAASMSRGPGLWHLMATLWRPREPSTPGVVRFTRSSPEAGLRPRPGGRHGGRGTADASPSPTAVCSNRQDPHGLVQEGYAIAAYVAVEQSERLESATGGAGCSTPPRSTPRRPPRKAMPSPNATFGSCAPGERRDATTVVHSATPSSTSAWITVPTGGRKVAGRYSASARATPGPSRP